MIKINALQDESGHWYLVPNELVALFHEMVVDYNREDEFTETFSQYETGGDINLKQLYTDEE